ncbi:class I SAM-dependent methyltransferase [Pedobacter nyackensis]|uniref:class I SAM-dependent methyltransferase n=1 Tax=Pedobacter nyackensis TaxID=475255 RepID=UPI00292DF151|nr:class I SAM-dependent methyltransferase [Pedobacter nyackensis]
MENRENVFEVYNKIAAWFATNRYGGLMEQAYLDEMIGLLNKGASVLDLGCGTGKPILAYLITRGLDVVGVDGSTEMLALAQKNFPSTEFVLADMRNLYLNKKFDAIIAWHSFFHLPAADQPAMFETFSNHLKPNGVLLFTSGTEYGEAWGMNGGENLFHASLSTETYKEVLEKHGFKVLKHVMDDADCGGATVWMAQYV